MLRRTQWWWLPSVLLLVGSVVVFATLPPAEHGEGSAFSAMARGIEVLAGLALAALGIIWLGIAAALHSRKKLVAQETPPDPLPVAKVLP
jgi:hypothetical protein